MEGKKRQTRWKAGKKAGGRWKLRKKSCLTKILARWEAHKRNNKNRDESRRFVLKVQKMKQTNAWEVRRREVRKMCVEERMAVYE